MNTNLKHVAFIMDGNRRWARDKKLAIFLGHSRGEDRIEPIIDEAIRLGISHLTFWGFSTENWNRDKREVNFLMRLYREILNTKMDVFHKKKVRIKVIGNLALFPKDIQAKTHEWMEKTKENHRIFVNFALSYGGRDEILRAINSMVLQGKPTHITANYFESFLDTYGQPDPDLIIRTGGVQRTSGFLLWQSEYSEFYFTEVLWPDFSVAEFRKAIDDYANRQRRFGR